MSFLYTTLYAVGIGGLFIYLFIFTYDLLFGEKYEKQVKKIYKHFRKESIQKLEILDHQPKKFTIFKVMTDSGEKKIKLKPGYKIIKLTKKQLSG